MDCIHLDKHNHCSRESANVLDTLQKMGIKVQHVCAQTSEQLCENKLNTAQAFLVLRRRLQEEGMDMF